MKEKGIRAYFNRLVKAGACALPTKQFCSTPANSNPGIVNVENVRQDKKGSIMKSILVGTFDR